MGKKIKASMQSLIGIVIPYAWDNNDEVIAVSLSATDDEDYVIENGERFLDLIHQKIRAEGLVRQGKKMHRAITIKKFELLENIAIPDNPL